MRIIRAFLVTSFALALSASQSIHAGESRQMGGGEGLGQPEGQGIVTAQGKLQGCSTDMKVAMDVSVGVDEHNDVYTSYFHANFNSEGKVVLVPVLFNLTFSDEKIQVLPEPLVIEKRIARGSAQLIVLRSTVNWVVADSADIDSRKGHYCLGKLHEMAVSSLTQRLSSN